MAVEIVRAKWSHAVIRVERRRRYGIFANDESLTTGPETGSMGERLRHGHATAS